MSVGDEAMAMGAAFRAANLSTAFRVRKVGAVCVCVVLHCGIDKAILLKNKNRKN